MKEDRTNTGVAESPVTKKSVRVASHSSDATSATAEAQTEKASVEEKPTGPHKTIWREYFEAGLVIFIMALFGMAFIVQAVVVPTGSMQNTILIGDHLLVNKFIFAPGGGSSIPFLPQREIRRGDIIVFKYPGNKYDPQSDYTRDTPSPPFTTNFVKRVIGLPGDRIEIRGERVIVNNQFLPERLVIAEDDCVGAFPKDPCHDAPLKVIKDAASSPDKGYNVYYSSVHSMTEPYPTFEHEGDGKSLIVPPGNYFAMGDNRDNSEDSRYWAFVPRDLIVGRAMFVYWSYDKSAPSSNNFLLDFLRNTRWSRTGTMVR